MIICSKGKWPSELVLIDIKEIDNHACLNGNENVMCKEYVRIYIYIYIYLKYSEGKT